ncbi:MAG: hypothetical protein WAL48_00025, partial [Xanthobacteraceae bacterium]
PSTNAGHGKPPARKWPVERGPSPCVNRPHPAPSKGRYIAVPAAEPFGQEIAVARTIRERGPLTAAFEQFFMEAARAAYPAGGFTAESNFRYGATVNLIER